MEAVSVTTIAVDTVVAVATMTTDMAATTLTVAVVEIMVVATTMATAVAVVVAAVDVSMAATTAAITAVVTITVMTMALTEAVLVVVTAMDLVKNATLVEAKIVVVVVLAVVLVEVVKNVAAVATMTVMPTLLATTRRLPAKAVNLTAAVAALPVVDLTKVAVRRDTAAGKCMSDSRSGDDLQGGSGRVRLGSRIPSLFLFFLPNEASIRHVYSVYSILFCAGLRREGVRSAERLIISPQIHHLCAFEIQKRKFDGFGTSTVCRQYAKHRHNRFFTPSTCTNSNKHTFLSSTQFLRPAMMLLYLLVSVSLSGLRTACHFLATERNTQKVSFF